MNTIFDLKDQIIVITGGLGQLGLQYARALVNQGALVGLFDVFPDGGKRLKDFFSDQEKDQLLYCPVDVTQRKSIEEGLNSIQGKWGIPHGLINNAALDSPPNAPLSENGPFEDYPEESWDRVMDVNVKGVFLTSQVIGKAMVAAGHGSIVNISSIYGMVSPDQGLYEYRRQKGEIFFKPVAYSASKSALLNLTRYLATYWAKKGVRVNTLTLAGVFNHQDDDFLKEYTRRVPMGRMAKPDEYCGAVTFLLSEASSYMTGANLVVDGGWTAI